MPFILLRFSVKIIFLYVEYGAFPKLNHINNVTIPQLIKNGIDFNLTIQENHRLLYNFSKPIL